MRSRHFFFQFDWWFFSVVTAIITIGLLSVNSASHSLGLGSYYFIRQLIWVAVSMAMFFVMQLVDFRFLCRISFYLHFFAILLLVLTLFVGTGSNTSDVRRWLIIGPFALQTSELVKFTMVLTLAHFFRDGQRFGKLGLFRFLYLCFVIFVPFLLIVRQPDLGTAILFFATSLVLVFLGGISYRWFLGAFVLILLAAPLAWQYGLKEYQKDRILTMLQPTQDRLGKGYHINQSVIAIGSGGAFGKGYLQGTQAQLNFLPARHTDFIFALYAEEWGFVGSFFLLMLYVLLIFFIFKPVGKYKYATSNLVTVGVGTILASHIFINLGMVNRLIPVVGVPLPFMSYGGSAMLSMMFGVALVMKIRTQRVEESI